MKHWLKVLQDLGGVYMKGNFSLKIKSRAQQITLNPNIIKVKNVLANVSLFTIEHLHSNLNEFTGYGIYIYKIMV
jgi:hypothetical protein